MPRRPVNRSPRSQRIFEEQRRKRRTEGQRQRRSRQSELPTTDATGLDAVQTAEERTVTQASSRWRSPRKRYAVSTPSSRSASPVAPTDRTSRASGPAYPQTPQSRRHIEPQSLIRRLEGTSIWEDRSPNPARVRLFRSVVPVIPSPRPSHSSREADRSHSATAELGDSDTIVVSPAKTRPVAVSDRSHTSTVDLDSDTIVVSPAKRRPVADSSCRIVGSSHSLLIPSAESTTPTHSPPPLQSDIGWSAARSQREGEDDRSPLHKELSAHTSPAPSPLPPSLPSSPLRPVTRRRRNNEAALTGLRSDSPASAVQHPLDSIHRTYNARIADDEYRPVPTSDSDDSDSRLELPDPSDSNPHDRLDVDSDAAEGTLTERTRDRILESACLTGCSCASARPDLATGLTLQEVCHRWQELGIPDILCSVAQEVKLPDCQDSFLWQTSLSGLEDDRLPTEEVGDERPVPTRMALSFDRSCLLAQGEPVQLHRSWDIDALILPLKSLAACQGGIDFYYYPRFGKTIARDWHTPVTREGIVVKKCKHLRIARGTGPIHYEVYAFFPGLPVNRSARRSQPDMAPQCYPTQTEQAEWVDTIIVPSLRQVYSDDILQHHPRSFRECADRSKARQTENVTKAERAFAEAPYFLPNQPDDRSSPAPLAQFWTEVRRRASTSPVWSGVQLVALSFDTKLAIRAGTISALQDRLDRSLDLTFDRSLLDLPFAFLDLAYEDMAAAGTGQETGGPVEPLVLLHRSSCQEAEFKELGLGHRSQTHNWHGTSGATSRRAAPGSRSPLRQGGLAYIQAYHSIKDMFVNPLRTVGPVFSDPSFRSLAFSKATLEEFHSTLHRSAYDPRSRERSLHALRATISRVHYALEANFASPTGFGVRKEFRISWPLLQAVRTNISRPWLQSQSHHWPYFALYKKDIVDFIRWDVNRWLHGICAVIGSHRPVATHGQAPTSLQCQQENAAMLAALFAALELVINDSAILRSARLSQDWYTRRWSAGATGRRGRILEDITVGNGAVRLGEADGGTSDDARPVEGSRTGRRFRGLAFASSSAQTNLIWLPDDMFYWDRLRFIPDRLQETTFVTARYLTGQNRDLLHTEDSIFRAFVGAKMQGLHQANPLQLQQTGNALAQLCIFRFANDMIDRAHRTGQFPTIESNAVSDDERTGRHGLSYGLVRRATGRPPVLCFAREGQKDRNPRGFGAFPLDWETRLQLLFDWDDGFDRSAWENSSWRLWTRYCYTQLGIHAPAGFAQDWKSSLGQYSQPFLTIIPQYDNTKLAIRQKLSQAAVQARRAQGLVARPVQWCVARPVEWETATGPLDIARWEMVTAHLQRDVEDLPGLLPLIYEHQPVLLQGRRLELIDELATDWEQE